MTEAQLHRAVAAYLRLAIKPPAFFTTFPAGGGGKVRGGQLKAMGLLPGMPDLLVFWPIEDDMGNPEPAVLGIELKTTKGSISPQQKIVAKLFDGIGGDVAVCRSIDDVAKALALWAVPLHASVMGAT